METRAQALQEFYGGPVWKAHRDAANETMIDSDNVLLLRPAQPSSGFSIEHLQRRPRGATESPRGILVATICHLEKGESGEKMAESSEERMRSELSKKSASLLACFVGEHHPNTFPALPVREDANVVIWFSMFAERADSSVCPEKTETLRLQPTPRSRLHG